jgi:hypothetical protein
MDADHRITIDRFRPQTGPPLNNGRASQRRHQLGRCLKQRVELLVRREWFVEAILAGAADGDMAALMRNDIQPVAKDRRQGRGYVDFQQGCLAFDGLAQRLHKATGIPLQQWKGLVAGSDNALSESNVTCTGNRNLALKSEIIDRNVFGNADAPCVAQ